MQEGIDWSVKLPGGRKKSGHYDFPEGEKQQAGVSWNMAGARRWEAWVNLNSAMAAREDAEATLQELQQLRNDPVEAQLQVDEAEAAYRAAQAEVEVAKANLAQLQAGPRAEEVALAEAQTQQAEAALAALKVDRQKHVLVAPVSGWVAERVAQEGEMASPGMPLMTVADLSEVTLTVYVPEPDIDTIALGQEIEVFVDTFPNKPFIGHITFINDKAEFTPKNVQTKEERMTTVFAVEIKLDNPDQELKPGMPADAILSEGPEL
jgi:multidrug resistance efflux pump